MLSSASPGSTRRGDRERTANGNQVREPIGHAEAIAV
jgi:hypothetical protein